MASMRWGFVIAIPVMAALVTCGTAAQDPATRALPEWAPRNPSPEFRRAAALIKPISMEAMKSPRLSGKAQEEYVRRHVRWIADGYELFGSLNDRQIERFQAVQEIRIPVKALTRKQRALMRRYCADTEDPQYVRLYKMGARKDLSNVDFGFTHQATFGGGAMVDVSPAFWVRQRDGTDLRDCYDIIGYWGVKRPAPVGKP